MPMSLNYMTINKPQVEEKATTNLSWRWGFSPVFGGTKVPPPNAIVSPFIRILNAKHLGVAKVSGGFKRLTSVYTVYGFRISLTPNKLH